MAKTRRGPKSRKHDGDPTAMIADPVAIPSNHREFIGRAKRLIDYPDYAKATDFARADWNAQFPRLAFAKQSRDPPPDLEDIAPSFYAWLDFPFPLTRILPKNYWQVSWQIRYCGASLLEPHTKAAHDYWYECVLSMCREWWPDPPFTVWDNPRYTHPAMKFVAASLIWDIDTFSDDHLEKWMQPTSYINIALLPFDPTDPRKATEVEYWRTYSLRMLEQLTEAIIKNGSVTRNTLPEICIVAKQDALKRWDEVSRDVHMWVRPYPILPLKYGITAKDVKNVAVFAESAAIRYQGTNEERIRLLAEQGMKVSQIARDFGMTEPGIRKILKRSNAARNRLIKMLVEVTGVTEDDAKKALDYESADVTK